MWYRLTFFAVLFRLHLSDLVLGAQYFAVVVTVEEMDACDELLRQLGLRLALCSGHKVLEAYLVDGILKLGQSVTHICKLPTGQEGNAVATC